MSHSPILVTSLGSIASRVLAQTESATVWGIASRGIYLHLSSGWVIYLSYEPFRGPLTLNIIPSPTLWKDIEAGTPVHINNKVLHFYTLDLPVDTNRASLWSAPSRVDASAARLAGCLDRLEYIYQKALASQNRVSGVFSPEIPNAIRQENPPTAAALIQYLGLGAGLTPAGDDLALGCLLAINRWGDLLCPSPNIAELNQAVCQAARCKTSALSASLIECAALGQADERLILALDGIITGKPEADACVAHILGWGHSSGLYALQGMAWAIHQAISLGFTSQVIKPCVR